MTLKGVFFEDLGMAEAIWVIEPTDCRWLWASIHTAMISLILSYNMRNGNMNRTGKKYEIWWGMDIKNRFFSPPLL